MTKEEMRKFAKCYGSDLLGHRDDEVRVSDVWDEREGGASSMTSLKFAWMKACIRARLPDHLDQQICKPKKKKEWVNCMLNALVVLDGSVSMCLYSKGHLMEH